MLSPILNIAHRKTLHIAIIIVGVTFINFWVYRLFQTNILLGILLILESYFLYLSLFLRSRKITSLIFVILILLGFFLIKNNIDKTIFVPTEMESIQKLKNHEYYANELGKIYKNKLGLLILGEPRPLSYHFSYKLFSFLDIRTYFGFDSKQNLYYPTFFFLFFMFGFIHLLLNPKITPIVYACLALFSSVFISVGNSLDPILLFPLLNTLIALGFIQLTRFLRSLFG